MNVLQAIESSGPGGAERTLFHLSSGLRERGHRVRVLLLRPGWLSDELGRIGIDTEILTISRPVDVRLLNRLAREVRAFRADVLHTHEFSYAVYGRLATRGRVAVHVATAHGDNFVRGMKRGLLGRLLLRGARFQLACVSGDLSERIARRLRIPMPRVQVVPNGIPLPEPAGDAGRQSGEPLRLLAIGNLYPVKNHALAIRAVGMLKRSGVAVTFDILGRGEEEARLQALIDSEGLAEQVQLRGFRHDVVSFLSRSHVLVSTSLHEGMPVSFLEAMCRRVPVVAPRVGGIPEMIEDGRQGLLFEPQDLGGLVTALRRLAEDERLRFSLALEADRLVRREFSADKMIDRYQALYASRT